MGINLIQRSLSPPQANLMTETKQRDLKSFYDNFPTASPQLYNQTAKTGKTGIASSCGRNWSVERKAIRKTSNNFQNSYQMLSANLQKANGTRSEWLAQT